MQLESRVRYRRGTAEAQGSYYWVGGVVSSQRAT